MAHTNSTDNYGLPQWIGTDKPTFLGDFNTAFGTIDTQMKANADAATTAVATANSADAVASSANTNATTALNTANSAAADAASAVSTASTANSTANTAATNAATALRASAANSIENLAPAYDATLTYAVGDLVTYIDAQNSGKLYKCIVAVNSPMEFNINYWDDVTTSEVYGEKKNYHDFDTDGTETWGDLLQRMIEWCVANVPVNKWLDLHFYQVENGIPYGSCNRVSTARYSSDAQYTLLFSNIAGTINYFETALLGGYLYNGVFTQIISNYKVNSDNTVVYTANPTATVSARTFRLIY